MSEVASVTDKIKIVHITIIPIESIIMKIVVTVLPLLEGENSQENKDKQTKMFKDPSAAFVIGISKMGNFFAPSVHYKMCIALWRKPLV